jgi:hypothetical protein
MTDEDGNTICDEDGSLLIEESGKVVADPYTYGQIAVLIQSELRAGTALSYVPDNSIIICNAGDKDIIPSFKDYLIRIFPPDSGFIVKTPKIGRYFRTTYILAIELWVKSSSSTEKRLLSGNLNSQKGIWDFFKDTEGILEHNTLSNNLQPYAGSNIKSPVPIKSDERMIEGLGFLWYGNQDNLR